MFVVWWKIDIWSWVLSLTCRPGIAVTNDTGVFLMKYNLKAGWICNSHVKYINSAYINTMQKKCI